MKTILKLISIVILFSSCEKNNQSELIHYDCLKKTTDYNSADEILYWYVSFYKNDKRIKLEYSDGSFQEYKYDSFGNTISVISNGNKTEYEYNSDNKVVKTKYYTNNQLDYYRVSVYKDTLIDRTYGIDNKNDTIGWSLHFYNSKNRIDSIKSDHTDTYFFYSSEIDSIISKSKEDKIKSKMFLKYLDGNKIYEEGRLYSFFNEEYRYYIKNWEYNEKGLLIRQTEDHLYVSGETQWIDIRKIYNTNNRVSRSELYDASNNLIAYSIYFYKNQVLVKSESYDNQNNLTSYSLFEDTCN